METKTNFKLLMKHGRVHLKFFAKDEEVPVKIAWFRPLTGNGCEVSFIDEQKKEIAMAQRLSDLDPDSRALAEAEIEQRYLMPRITAVRKTQAEFGAIYWEVETTAGRRTFALREPEKNITSISDEHLILRDTIGNRYEITSLGKLDEHSRREIDKVV